MILTRRCSGIVALIIVMAFTLTACSQQQQSSSIPDSSSQSEVKAPVTIGVSMSTFDDNYMSFVHDEFKRLDEQDDSLLIKVTDAEDNAQFQLNNINELLAEGATALAVSLADVQSARSVCELATQAMVPLVFFGQEPSAEVLSEFSGVWYAGVSQEDAGKAQAQLISEHFTSQNIDKNGDGKIQLLVLTGEQGNPLAELRATTLLAGLGEENIEVLAQQSANWDEGQAMQFATDWLTEFPQAEVLAAGSDSMALGAAKAYTQQTDTPMVYGIDAIPEAVQAVSDGHMSGTILDDPSATAQAVVAMLANVARGEGVTAGTDLQVENTNAVRVDCVVVQ